MDDDLLADDGQYKDDGLDDLDIDAEAALLGLSDEEIEGDRSPNDDQELEYVDEDGNPVSIGENNADLYEVANIEHDKRSNAADEDVLELDDLDAELDSFNQETSDLNESPAVSKSYNDRQRKENLISLTSKKEQERPPLRRKESRYSPEDDQDRSSKDKSISSQSHSSRVDSRNVYMDELEFDEESEDENIADDHRERFKSERSNIITLTPANRRTDIPDTLESVISVEETAKVQAFLENEQKKKMRFKGKMQGRMKTPQRFQRPPQNFNSNQGHRQGFNNNPGPSQGFGSNQGPPQGFGSNQGPSQGFNSNQGPPQGFGNNQGPPQGFSSNQGPPQGFSSNQGPPQGFNSAQCPPQSFGSVQGPPQSFGSVQGPPQSFNSSQGPPQNFNNAQGPPQSFNNVQGAPQNFNTSQGHQPPQFSNSSSSTVSQPPTSAPQPRKILINPHFRGVRIPPPTEQVHSTLNEPPQVSAPPPSSYEPPNFTPPVQYSQQEPMHSVSVAPPPIYTAPPAVQYKHPEYPPPQQPPVQQMPPHTWQQTPDVSMQSYSVPPPVMNYADPVPQPPNYNNYNQNYQNTNYQNPPMPMPQSVNYNQPPPPVHVYSQSFPTQPNPVSSNMAHTQFSPAPNQIRMQTSVQPRYQDPSMNAPHAQAQKPKFTPSPQRVTRFPEKRLSNSNIKHLPHKQPRLEQHPPRKPNVHVNSSNIREIPLVDNLPATRKTTAIKTVPIVEDEDEKTKELRKKIEEQKLLREQILKRKEERRRQMAAQRLSELQKRQIEQNRNAGAVLPKGANTTANVSRAAIPVKPVLKQSVKERIGLPVNKNLPATKKKIVVVRKKAAQQTPVVVVPNSAKAPAIVGQRLKLPVPSQRQEPPKIAKPSSNVPSQENAPNKQIAETKSEASDSSKKSVPVKQENKAQLTNANQKKQITISPRKMELNSPAQKGRAIRFGARPPFQRPQFSPMQRMQRHRHPGPRAGPYPSPHFVEPRMPFPDIDHGPPPMNEVRMPPPHFQEHRPPLLPFHPHGEPRPLHPGPRHFFPHDHPFEPPNSPPFHMHGHGGPNFRAPGMEPMFHDRFPRPTRFQNPVPQMRHMGNNNMQRFQRPRFQHHGKQRFPLNNSANSNQKPSNISNQKPKIEDAKLPSSSPKDLKSNQKPNVVVDKSNEVKPATNQPKIKSEDKSIPTAQTVSVENLSSSTTEPQLRKLCSTVGVVETFQLLKSERKAVIKFKEPRQALHFQKKYQRYMLDLAMIQVSMLST